MFSKMRLMLMSVLLLFAVLPVQGQEAPPECDFQQVYDTLNPLWTASASMEDLQAFYRDLGSSLAYCRELYWQGDGAQESTVIGPFIIPAGIYRLVGTTNDFLSVTFEPIGEECESHISPLLVSRGEAVNGSEIIYRNEEDCETLMTVSNVQSAWTVEFRPIQ